ncbi:MAG: AAA family ATPase [Deltaproteobacteria bacterium]|jgi:hypothetical protein|nr:AAA family ATPase [Deltaproteobacteria bacterium]
MSQEGLPLLPLGWTTFEELRQNRAVYVDKTKFLPMISDAGKYVFCARPRRFGKSLTISAIDAFCSGRTELFRGLAVEKDMVSPCFISKPVINLDMNSVAGSRNIDILEKNFWECLGDIAKRHGVSLRGADSARAFLYLMKDVRESSDRRIVVLIDEYDSPVITIIRNEMPENGNLLDLTRYVMREFYSQIKSADKDIESVFITGVTKFSKMGVFSELNNLVDISIRPQFGEFMGYTQNELIKNFRRYITNTAEELKMDEKDLLDKLGRYYDGFSFDGQSKLYNPFSVLSFFGEKQFDNF